MATQTKPAARRGTKKARAPQVPAEGKALSGDELVTWAVKHRQLLDRDQLGTLTAAQRKRYVDTHPGGAHRVVRHPVPSVGRIVHVFLDATLVPSAAIVQATEGRAKGRITAFVFAEGGARFMRDVPYAPEPTTGSWSWPARVEDEIEQVPLSAEEVAAEGA